MAQHEIARLEGSRFPMVKYQRNPVGFVRDMIGEGPLDHQAEILLALAGDPSARVAVRSGQKQGKALALDTPIPTPRGWTTMGELRDGDTVFGADGAPCLVTSALPPYLAESCYDVEFTDGTVVRCDGEHLWETWSANARRNSRRGLCGWGPSVVDTKQISGEVGTKHRGRNYSIRNGEALSIEAVELPIPPYTLGVWLGDGNTADGYLFLADRDFGDLEAGLAGEGYAVIRTAAERGCGRYKASRDGKTLSSELRAQGLLGAKRVPPEYLRASEAQRRALLRGLLDTDGTCGVNGVEFDSTVRQIADSVFELACSLGYRPTLTSRIGKLRGVEKKRCWRVRFAAHENPFSVSWKAAKWRAPHYDTLFRTIKAVRPVAPEMVRCIEVDSPSALYLCSRAMIPTHNTKLVVWAALWFFACFPGARVFMTASTAPQVNRVLWKELRLTAATAKRKGTDFGEIPLNPERGAEALDGRSIQGFTTRTIEAMAGLSGANMLFIGDEASSFENDMAEAIQGNTAGAARIIWISNPTRAEGPFYDCFFSKRKFWTTYHLNSEDLAAKVAKGLAPRVPGIATPEVIARWKEEYGVDSPFYLVRVKGDFVLDEQARCVSLHNILEAQKRWPDAPDNDGSLSIGIDPAGDRGEGDRFTFAVVRGAKLLAVYAFRGLSEEAAIAHGLGLLKEFRRGDETPVVVVDAEGPIGAAYYGRMRAIAIHKEIHNPPEAYVCYGIKSSQPARREPQLYERIRDELWANLSRWFQTGAIPTDRELEEEVYSPGFLVTVRGQRKVTHKDVLREKLGRSPDKADALCLAVWTPSPWVPGEGRPELPQEDVNVGPGADTENEGGSGLDPYGAGKGGGFSPY